MKNNNQHTEGKPAIEPETNPVPADVNIEESEDNFLFDYEEVTISDIRKMEDVRIIPSDTREGLAAFSENMNKEIFSKSSNEVTNSISLALESEEYINPEDIGARELTKNITNEPTHDGVPLVTKDLTISKRVKTQKSALIKLTQKVGIGTNINIPLWHSGFWVTFAPLLDDDIINLELEIVNELTRIGKETTTLVYSNYNVIFAEVILKYFKEKIINASINIDDESDIADYININDIYPIALHMAKTMYPHGFQVVIPCTNNTKLNEDGSNKCSYKARLKVDLSKLLFVDETKLTQDHLQQMAKKTPKSVTVDDVIKYQETLPTAGEEEIVFNVDGEETKLILGPVSASRYIESGQGFINELKDKAVNLIKNNNQIDSADKAERTILNGIYLNVYSHYIKGIPLDDTVITDTELVREALNIFTSNHELSKKVMESIKKYIDNTQIAIVGIPSFVCPNCESKVGTKELIPLAVYEYFFILLHSKYEKVMERL